VIRPYLWTLLAATLGVLAWSFISPEDRFTWFLEVAPFLIALPILAATARRFPLTPLLYTLIAIHAIILMVGGHYTYARVPLGYWMKDFFHFTRNHYDRIGHFAQGFVPAIVARELLLRHHFVPPQRVAAISGRVFLPGVQRILRVDRMVDGRGDRRGVRCVSRHARRPVGHAVGHVLRADRIDHRAGHALTPARSPARRPADRNV
jgi:Predicted membrane protein (DUF2238)